MLECAVALWKFYRITVQQNRALSKRVYGAKCEECGNSLGHINFLVIQVKESGTPVVYPSLAPRQRPEM